MDGTPRRGACRPRYLIDPLECPLECPIRCPVGRHFATQVGGAAAALENPARWAIPFVTVTPTSCGRPDRGLEPGARRRAHRSAGQAALFAGSAENGHPAPPPATPTSCGRCTEGDSPSRENPAEPAADGVTSRHVVTPETTSDLGLRAEPQVTALALRGLGNRASSCPSHCPSRQPKSLSLPQPPARAQRPDRHLCAGCAQHHTPQAILRPGFTATVGRNGSGSEERPTSGMMQL